MNIMNKTVINERVYKYFYKYQYYKHHLILTILSLVNLFIFNYNLIKEYINYKKLLDLILIPITSLSIIIFFIYSINDSKKTTKRKMDFGLITEYIFYENYIIFKTNKDNIEIKYLYSDFKKIIETNNLFIFVNVDDHPFIIDKQGFQDGNYKDLRKILDLYNNNLNKNNKVKI